MDQFHTKVAGVTFKNSDGQKRQDLIRTFCRPGMSLILRAEPNNQHDPHAVAVWMKVRVFIFFSDTVQIGYLGGHLAEGISDELLAGRRVDAEISDVTGGQGKESYGVNIMITNYAR